MIKINYYLEINGKTILEHIKDLYLGKNTDEKYKIPKEAECVVLKKETKIDNEQYYHNVTIDEAKLLILNSDKYDIINDEKEDIYYIYCKENDFKLPIINSSRISYKLLDNYQELQKYTELIINNFKENSIEKSYELSKQLIRKK